MKTKIAMLALVLMVTPVRAQDATPTPTATAAPTPVPTPVPTIEPPCEQSGPLVPCRARIDPATTLNQRIDQLEKQFAQLVNNISGVLKQTDERLKALEDGGKKK